MIKRIAALAAALIATLLLTWWLSTTTFISDTLAPVLFTAFVFISDFFQSLPQYILWFFFVLIAARFVLVALFRLFKLWSESRDEDGQARISPPRGSVERYSIWITQSAMGAYFRRRMVTQMARTTMAAIQPEHNHSLLEIERAIDRNTPGLPDDVALFLNSIVGTTDEPTGYLGQLQERIRKLSPSAETNHDDLFNTIRYIETHLGITAPEGTLEDGS